MESKYTALAYLPWKGMALRSGDKAFFLDSDGTLEERFPMFPEAAVYKYNYTEIKPFTGTIKEILEVLKRLDAEVRIP